MLGLISIYALFYMINMNFNFYELKNILKIFYFPIILMVFYSLLKDKGKFIDKNILLISLGIYSFVIVFAFLTHTSFNSYSDIKLGNSGYFYAANEIGNIIAILLPFCFNYVFNKINVSKIFYFILIVTAILILGTKTPFISLVICSVYYISKLINRDNILKMGPLLIIGIIFIVILLMSTPIYKNVIIYCNYLKVDSIKSFVADINNFDHLFFGLRLKLLRENTIIYLNSGIYNQLFGIGYINHSKLVEMDFFDILYRQGIMGFISYFTTIIYLFSNGKKFFNVDYIFPLILIMLIASIAGHVLVAPAVSIFVATILTLSMGGQKNES
jgi:hypothetical protein